MSNISSRRISVSNPSLTVISVSLLILMLISPSKNLLTWLTLVMGPVIVLDSLYLPQLMDNVLVSKYSSKFMITGALLPFLGIYLGHFGAAFSIAFIPFGFYFLVAILVVTQLFLSIQWQRKNRK